MYLCTDHLVICGQLENCTLTFVCPLALKDKLGGLHHSLVTNCLKGRCTFFVFNEVTSFCTSCFKIVLTRDFRFSDYVHDDTFSEMEEEGMEEIPKEILNAIDSFNVESDEEFLGFE